MSDGWIVRAACRVDEMSQRKLALGLALHRDGDVVLWIQDQNGTVLETEPGLNRDGTTKPGLKAQVEFCTISGGGGRSSHTLAALLKLLEAMMQDARETNDGVPEYPLWLREKMKEGK